MPFGYNQWNSAIGTIANYTPIVVAVQAGDSVAPIFVAPQSSTIDIAYDFSLFLYPGETLSSSSWITKNSYLIVSENETVGNFSAARIINYMPLGIQAIVVCSGQTSGGRNIVRYLTISTGPGISTTPVFLLNEIDFIKQQSYGPTTPGYVITRTPIGNLQAPWAEGTWSAKGYTPPSYPVATIDGDPNYAYTGAMTGTLSQPLTNGQYLVIFAVTDQAYQQITLTVTGTTWSLTNTFAGTKLAVVYNTAGQVISSSECYPKWFDPTLQVDNYLVTDLEYYQFSNPLFYDGTWRSNLTVDYITRPSAPTLYGSFPNGAYVVRLVSEPTASVLAFTVLLDGLVRSYKIPTTDPAYITLNNRSYCYDQALSIIASLAYSDTVFTDRLVSGLIHSQSIASGTVGMWFFSVDAYTASPPDPYFRVGAHAYCILALCLYLKVRGSSQYGSQITAAITSAIAAMLAFQQTSGPQSGLMQLGLGEYVNDIFEPGTTNPIVHNASTEHNIDAYFALQAANVILPGHGYGTAATTVATGLSSILWGHAIYGFASFLQGITNTGVYDTADALDINTLGCLFWLAQSNPTNAATALAAAGAFKFTLPLATGYAPYLSTQGYPGALPNVWSEGTSYLALATLRSVGQDTFSKVMQGIVPLRNPDGGWTYCEINDPLEELADWESISGTAMAIIALTPSINQYFFANIS